MIFLRLLPALACLVASPLAAQERPPVLDVRKTCELASQDEADGAKLNSCLRDEDSARDALKKSWMTFAAGARSQCSKQFEAGGLPSYVELLTCLQLAVDASSIEGGDASAGSRKSSDSALPRREKPPGEANPNQRTNPIDVLNDN